MNLEDLGLVELNAQEVQETDGGIIPLLLAGAALLLLSSCNGNNVTVNFGTMTTPVQKATTKIDSVSVGNGNTAKVSIPAK